MLVVKSAKEMAKTVLPEASILGMIYDAISKDPRDELRMLGSNSSFSGQSLEEFINTLNKSTHTGPFNPRSVKMNELNKIIIIIIMMAIKMITQKENLLDIQINVKFPLRI